MATKTAVAFPLRLPRSTHAQAMQAAREEGISLNQLITLAVVEKITRLERAKKHKGEKPGGEQQVEAV
jgi:hypothetical protein